MSETCSELVRQERAEMLALARQIGGPELTNYTPAGIQTIRGTVDGAPFYFRERDDTWHLEVHLDGAPDGTESDAIASGDAVYTFGDGDTPLARLTFIVDAVREHVLRRNCAHEGAGRYCPRCGARMADDGGGAS